MNSNGVDLRLVDSCGICMSWTEMSKDNPSSSSFTSSSTIPILIILFLPLKANSLPGFLSSPVMKFLRFSFFYGREKSTDPWRELLWFPNFIACSGVLDSISISALSICFMPSILSPVLCALIDGSIDRWVLNSLGKKFLWD